MYNVPSIQAITARFHDPHGGAWTGNKEVSAGVYWQIKASIDQNKSVSKYSYKDKWIKSFS